MKRIKSRIHRIEIIKEGVEDAKKNQNTGTKRLHIRGKHVNLPIINLPINCLMYRLENARTRRQQLKYLKKHPDLPSDIFEDPETLKAQEAQEEILLEMINLSGKDFVDDLIERGQEDPAIITYDGYIVNGNRRTAALRSINTDYIECVVLPENFKKKEIYDLELDLQISQDFKEPYHWINELIDIEQGIKDKAIYEDEKELARRLHIDVPRLKAKLRMKILVDSFLVWKGKAGEYDYEKLDEAEQDLIELEKETRKNKFNNNPALLDQAQKAVFVLIDEKPKVGRSYAWIRDLFKHFEQVYENVKQKSDVSATKKSPKSSRRSEILDALAGDENIPDVVDIFADSTPSAVSEKSALLQEAIKDVKAESMEKKDAEAVYDSVSEALRELQGLTIYKTTAKIEDIHNKLEEILKITSNLMKQAKKYYKK
jgi:ParB-like chromosome segregation protein Spo0J